MLFIAKRMLLYLERCIAKCKRMIADDLEMQRRLREVGADQWLPGWAKPDPGYWKKRIDSDREMLKHTKMFVMLSGLGR
jgi:hypothetical protein